MNTSIKQKKELWPLFIKACESQFMCGGERYALGEDKEFTDLVCEAVGDGWILGNIIKYCGEILNDKKVGNPQEVNYFKIAVYSFLAWIKQQDSGFEQTDKGERFDANVQE